MRHTHTLSVFCLILYPFSPLLICCQVSQRWRPNHHGDRRDDRGGGGEMGFSADTRLCCSWHQRLQSEFDQSSTNTPWGGIGLTSWIKACARSSLQGMRFLQLKNPWSHLRWKGRYCERDEKNWTPELLKYLNFDPKTAQKFDNGMHFLKSAGASDWSHAALLQLLRGAFTLMFSSRSFLDCLGGPVSVLWCHLPKLEPCSLQRVVLHSQVCSLSRVGYCTLTVWL